MSVQTFKSITQTPQQGWTSETFEPLLQKEEDQDIIDAIRLYSFGQPFKEQYFRKFHLIDATGRKQAPYAESLFLAHMLALFKSSRQQYLYEQIMSMKEIAHVIIDNPKKFQKKEGQKLAHQIEEFCSQVLEKLNFIAAQQRKNQSPLSV